MPDMLNLLSIAVFFVVIVVAIEICRRGAVWRECWRDKTAAWMAAMVVIGLACGTLLKAGVSIKTSVSVIFGVPLLLVIIWPLVGASVWLGKVSGLPINGLTQRGILRVFFECAVVGVFCVAVSMLLKLAGWTIRPARLPFWIQANDPIFVPVGISLYYLGLAAFEEFIYRGVLLRWVYWEGRRWKYARVIAILVSSAIFYLGHGAEFSLFKFVQIMVLGTGFAWISIRHGLWAAALTHWAFNIFGHFVV